jgi:hypothetical protein
MKVRALCTASTLWLILAVSAAGPGAAEESVESRLDAQLKLLYRAQRAERGVQAPATPGARPSEPPGSEQALEMVGRLRGGVRHFSRGASSQRLPAQGEPVEERCASSCASKVSRPFSMRLAFERSPGSVRFTRAHSRCRGCRTWRS